MILQDGYIRNPETNRCKKDTENANTGADYALDVPKTGEIKSSSTFVAFGAIIALVAASVVFVAFQFRREIAYHVNGFLQKIGLHTPK